MWAYLGARSETRVMVSVKQEMEEYGAASLMIY